ncbi:MAG: 4Fe-4S dicluster domain-containing protein [SAR202 cluster bacterium]|nr:4Fe-4S dicluster domain-containing protein [SAR202 cluster bacterium]
MGERSKGARSLREAPQDDEVQENNRKWEISRRQLLKVMGAAGAAGAAVSVAPKLLAEAEDSSVQTAESETPSKRLRRWSMVIDLRRCDGCQSIDKPPQCTQGCIEGHFAPEPMEWIQVFEYELPGGGTQFVPVPCQSCQNPPCVAVCPVGATWSTPEGNVLIDQERCIGCRMCQAACPYDRRFFNWADPPIPPQAMLADYHSERQFPMRRGVTSKCDFCSDMARAGRLPYCAQGCPNDAIYYGDFEEDLATNGEEVVELTKFLTENQAYRLKEELNTKPRVYYIPGHGQDVGEGRDPYKKGRMDSEWPWADTVKGGKRWKRSGR